MADGRVQIQSPVGLRAMQENGHGGDGDVGQRQHHNQIAPPWQVNQAGRGEAQEIGKGHKSVLRKAPLWRGEWQDCILPW